MFQRSGLTNEYIVNERLLYFSGQVLRMTHLQYRCPSLLIGGRVEKKKVPIADITLPPTRNE